MAENPNMLNATVLLLIRATLLAARFSGRFRRRSLNRLAAMDVDTKANHTQTIYPASPQSHTCPLRKAVGDRG